MLHNDENARVESIFFPRLVEKVAMLRDNRKRFVHYSTAEAAYSILSRKEIWMRRANCMNDFREIEHGLHCLRSADGGPNGVRLKLFLESVHSGLTAEINRMLSDWVPVVRNKTWLTSLSVHNESEDENGRLSMWRAYGGTAGIAIVIKGDVLFNRNYALGVVGHPVDYQDEYNYQLAFRAFVDGLIAAQEIVRSLDRETLRTLIFSAYRNAIVCTKHPGFAEEEEWRIVHTQFLDPPGAILKDTVTVRGTPQIIFRIPLKNIPDADFFGLEIPELLDRIIIGPCAHPDTIYEAFVDLLSNLQVSEAASKVTMSKIPLRQMS